MSDIGLYGIAAFLIGFAMLVVAGVGLLAEAALWWKRGRAAPLVFLAPLLYGAVALALLYIGEEGPPSMKRATDAYAGWMACAGLILWAIVRYRVRRRPVA